MPGWYYNRAGQQVGPLTSQQLKQLAAAGQLQPADLVWKEGMPQWVAASTIKGLIQATTSQQTPTAARAGTPGECSPGVPALAEWFFACGKQKIGPLTFAQLQQLAASSRLQRRDMVQQAGTPKWVLASSVAGLFAEGNAKPAATAEDDGGAELLEMAADMRRFGDEFHEMVQDLKKAVEGTGQEQVAAQPPRPAVHELPHNYWLPDLVMLRIPVHTRHGACVAVVVHLFLLVVLGAMAFGVEQLDKSYPKDEKAIHGVLGFLGLALAFLLVPWFLGIAFWCWGFSRACPSCQRLWARLLEREEFLGRSKGHATVTRSDRHTDKYGIETYGRTERQEQIAVTERRYRHHWVCRYCLHRWEDDVARITEGW